MAKGKPTLLDEIQAAVVITRAGPRTWFEKTPTDVQEELNSVRLAYRTGSLNLRKWELARAIHASLATRGIHSCKPAAIIRWLDQQ